MKGILLRVGADQTAAGGRYNAPVDPHTWRYAYVPIAAGEDDYEHIAPCPTFAMFAPRVAALGDSLPPHLNGSRVHLDPDFDSLTYGEPYLASNGRRASRGRLLQSLHEGDFIAFFAAFRPTTPGIYDHPLAYCLFALFFIHRVVQVADLSPERRATCAHGRRKHALHDLVALADPARSGRFPRAIPIGQYRSNAYRVRRDLLQTWGGLSVRDGYIQRSAQPPRFKDPHRFLNWLENQAAGPLLHHN